MKYRSQTSSKQSKTKIIIVDDHPLLRLGIINYIGKFKKFQLLAETGDSNLVIDLIEKHNPDIVILDVEMPGINGLDICRKIKERYKTVKVLFLTMHKEIDVFNKALKLGADGFLLKEHTLNELEIAIDHITQGKIYVGKEIEKMLNETKSMIVYGAEISEMINKLTKTEKTILQLLSSDCTTKEIAQKLFVSESTIKNHRHNIINKLQLDGDQNCLLKFATENIDFFRM